MDIDISIVIRTVTPYLDDLSALRASHVSREWRRGIWAWAETSKDGSVIYWIQREEITLEEYRRVYIVGEPLALCYCTHKLGLLTPISVEEPNSTDFALADHSTLKPEPKIASVMRVGLLASGDGVVSTVKSISLPLVYFTIQSLLFLQPDFCKARNLLRQTVEEVDPSKVLTLVSRCNAYRWDTDGKVRGSTEELQAQVEIYQILFPRLTETIGKEKTGKIIISNFPFIATWRNDPLILYLIKNLQCIPLYKAEVPFECLCLSRSSRMAERWYKVKIRPSICDARDHSWFVFKDLSPSILCSGSVDLAKRFYAGLLYSIKEAYHSVEMARIPKELVTQLATFILEATRYSLSVEHHFELRSSAPPADDIYRDEVLRHIGGYTRYRGHLQKPLPIGAPPVYLISIEMDRWMRHNSYRYSDIISPYRYLWDANDLDRILPPVGPIALPPVGLILIRSLELVISSLSE